MIIFEPAKRKHHPGAVQRFQAGLFVWFLVLLLIAFYPPLWFLPPLTFLNPVMYLSILFLWIPFVLLNIRRYGFRVQTGFIIAGCILALIMSINGFVPYLLNIHRWGWTSEPVTGAPFIIYSTGECLFWMDVTSLPHLPMGLLTRFDRVCAAIIYLF
jgi:hypothetical protein